MSVLSDLGRRSVPVAPRRSPRGATAQPRPSLADQLEALTPRFDDLTQRARLGAPAIPAAEYDELEQLAQELARDLVAPFRGASRPALVHPPLSVSADGRRACW